MKAIQLSKAEPSLLPPLEILDTAPHVMSADEDLSTIPQAMSVDVVDEGPSVGATGGEAPAVQKPTVPSPTGQKPTVPLTRAECARVLQLRCPSCFAGLEYGRPLDSYVYGLLHLYLELTDCFRCDIHVAGDGNFHHRHMISAGDSPHFFDPAYILSKEFVDSVGARMEEKRKGPCKPYSPKVPNEAVDECEQSYEAADGKKVKTSAQQFDDTGLMALVCRHDIPLFFANIDTPGEQQKYMVALIEHLFSLIPEEATVACLYDVGCVLDRTLSLVSLR